MKKILLSLFCLLPAGSAFAATGDVLFNGIITSTCAVTVGIPGVLDVDAASKVLSSKQGAGQSGTAAILATGANFSLSTIAPTAFAVAPDGGNDSVTFATSYKATGATTAGETPGATTTTLSAGLTTVNVDFTATKSTGIFNAGVYAGAVTVRCE